MSSSADTPIYNLKAVVQETSLKPDTLRAWERRYGLPAPQRTESGHRLYSQNDIDLLKWLMARQNDGMSISRAVELWRRLEAESRDPLQALPMTQGSTATTQSVAIGSMTASSGSYAPDDAISRLRDEWITCCLHFDEQCADRIVTQSFALFPVETVCKEVLQKGLAVIGEQWYLGDITVQQEHFASALALRRIEALLTATPPPTRPGRILIGCPPDEVHTFAPLILTLLLRRRGWNVIFLGANVPIQDFIFTVQTTRPQFVILTAQLLYTAAGVREMGELIRAINVPMGYGGLIFAQLPELHQHIAGHYLGDTFESAIEQAEKQMFAPRLPRPVAPLSPQLEEALTQFWSHQQQIEIEVCRSCEQLGISHALLHHANTNFGRAITAALALGDIHYLGIDLPWLRGLLENHYQLPKAVVEQYVALYFSAANKVLHGKSAALINWLSQVVFMAQSSADVSTPSTADD